MNTPQLNIRVPEACHGLLRRAAARLKAEPAFAEALAALLDLPGPPAVPDSIPDSTVLARLAEVEARVAALEARPAAGGPKPPKRNSVAAKLARGVTGAG